MRTHREGAVREQTWVTSNPREEQGSGGTRSKLDRGATQRKSPSPVSSSQWQLLISCLFCVSSVSMRLLCDLALGSVWSVLSVHVFL